MHVAIVGMACRFPGAPSISEFWKLLCEARSGIGPLPGARWDDAAILDDDPAAPGKSCVRVAGYLKEIDGFDALFFGISPREAAWMDPQQRIVLETVYEAVEDAGISMDLLARGRTSVYVGSCSNDYELLVSQPGIVESLSDPYAAIGIAPNVISGRVSYCFNLRGPSLTIDTACSSSLVAVHLACKSLEDGESTMALAAGVNIIASPVSNILLSKPKGIALDGVCRAFDARASGTVRGEGAGVVLLKPLEAALRDNDRIYAVIRGTAVLQDGRTNGLSAPNGTAQQEVIREALRRASVAASDIRYVEAHGTGTPLGDPIELMALGAVLSEGRAPGDRCGVGSVKTNIGHLEGAAGIAGLIKAALVLRHGEVPASLNFERPSANLPFDRLPLRVISAREPLARSTMVAAGVSSFGWSGTNAHAILTAAPSDERGAVPGDSRARLLPLSARSKSALIRLAADLAAMLRRGTDRWDVPVSVSDLCYSTCQRRSHHGYRLAIIGRSGESLAGALESFARGESAPGLAEGRKKLNHPPKIAFVFSGHGAQWHGMARELLAGEPVFRAALERIDAEARGQGWPSVLAELEHGADAERLRRADIALPLNFAVQTALAELLKSWGLRPDAVVGHSVGEISAAHVAGVLELTDAVKLVHARSELLVSGSGAGAMLLAELTLQQAELAREGRENDLWIGVNNGRRSCTFSGQRAALEELAAKLEQDGTFFRWVRANGAGHCPLVDPLLPKLGAAIAGLLPRRAKIPLYSTVNAALLGGEEMDVGYWLRNMREMVRFGEMFECMVGEGFDAFVEISPHPILSPVMDDDVAQARKHARVFPTMRRDEPEREALLRTLAQLYVLGAPVRWEAICSSTGRVASLPLYPWERKRYWLPDQPGSRAASTGRGLLGPRIDIADTSEVAVWPMTLNRETARDLFREHPPSAVGVRQAAMYIGIADRVARDYSGGPPYRLCGLAPGAPLHSPASAAEPVIGQVLLRRLDATSALLGIYSQESSPTRKASWIVNARMQLEPLPPDAIRRADAAIDEPGWSHDDVTTNLSLPANGSASLAMEACLEAARSHIGETALAQLEGIDEIRMYRPFSKEVVAHVRIASRAPGETACDVALCAPGGGLLASLRGVRFVSVEGEARQQPEESAVAPGNVSLIEKIASCSSTEGRHALVSEFLTTALAGVLRCEVSQIELHQPLAELGLDSLLGMQLRNRIESILGVTLSAAIAFRYPTAHQLATFIVERALANEDLTTSNIDVRTQLHADAPSAETA